MRQPFRANKWGRQTSEWGREKSEWAGEKIVWGREIFARGRLLQKSHGVLGETRPYSEHTHIKPCVNDLLE